MSFFNNQLKSLNIDGLHSLAVIHFANNQVSSINLDDTPNLNYIYCQNNLITRKKGSKIVIDCPNDDILNSIIDKLEV